MKRYFIVVIFLVLSLNGFALTQESLKKFPYQLISNDYGILNERNLKRYVDDTIPKPFNWEITGFDYWQCFPIKKVTVWHDKGVYDFDDKVLRSDPHISIQETSTTMHIYEPRRNFSLSYAKEKVATWKRLMKNEKNVCIGGAFAGTRKRIVDGKKIIEHGWIYENLKTNKGCDSYFSGWCQ